MLTEEYKWATNPSIFSLEIQTRHNLIHRTGNYYFNISTNANHCIKVEQFECTKVHCVDCMTSEHLCGSYHEKHYKIIREIGIHDEEK